MRRHKQQWLLVMWCDVMWACAPMRHRWEKFYLMQMSNSQLEWRHWRSCDPSPVRCCSGVRRWVFDVTVGDFTILSDKEITTHGKTKWSDSETKFIIYYHITRKQILCISRSSLHSDVLVCEMNIFHLCDTRRLQLRNNSIIWLMNKSAAAFSKISFVNQKTNWQTLNIWPLCILHSNLPCLSMLLLKYLFLVHILFSSPPWVCPSVSCLLIS